MLKAICYSPDPITPGILGHLHIITSVRLLHWQLMPYCKKEGNQEKSESKLKIKKITCTWKLTKQECIVMRQLYNSSWEIWILRCDHCRDRWCASELAEVAQEMQPLTTWFLCSVTVRQCHGIRNLQTRSFDPGLCCAAEKGSLDRTSTVHPLGPVRKPVFSSWKLQVMERFTLAFEGMVPPMLASSQTITNRFPLTFLLTFLGAFGHLIRLCEARETYREQVLQKRGLSQNIYWDFFLNC